MHAVELRRLGWIEQDIAAALAVTQGTVCHWLSAARRCGSQCLQSRPHPGRPAKLTAEQQRLIPDFLWHGAEAYGFRGEVWTCLRVAAVLAQEFGVWYSKSQVSRLLKELGWTPQVPLKRAIQRDEVAIELWQKQTWPQLLRQAQQERRTLVFIDESGFYLLPSVVRTYAPKGATPILQEWQTRDHLSVMGALTLEGKVYSLARQEALTGLHTVAFLSHLLRLAGDRLLIIWDGSPIHRRAEVKEFLASKAARGIQVERLPPYAPDLNPVEWLWSYLKEVLLGNVVCLDLEELHMQFHLALDRTRQLTNVTNSFFAGAGLPVDQIMYFLCNAQ